MFYHRSDEEFTVRQYLLSPEKLNTVDECRRWGAYASRAITEAQSFIQTMQEYQKLLYDRVQVLSAASWHYEALLLREPDSWKGKIFYYVQLLKVYDDPGIKTEIIENTKYPGSERRAAFAAFAALQKSRPGIISRKDIEKRRWER